MNKGKINGLLHVLGQLIGQGTVYNFVPEHWKPLASLIVAIFGALAAYSDTTLAQ